MKMPIGSLSNIQFARDYKVDANINLTFGKDILGPWEFLSLVYNKSNANPVDLFIKLCLNNQEKYLIHKVLGLTDTSYFLQLNQELVSPLFIEVTTTNVLAGTTNTCIVLYR